MWCKKMCKECAKTLFRIIGSNTALIWCNIIAPCSLTPLEWKRVLSDANNQSSANAPVGEFELA